MKTLVIQLNFPIHSLIINGFSKRMNDYCIQPGAETKLADVENIIDKIVESGTAHLVIDDIGALFETVYGPPVRLCSMDWYLIAYPSGAEGEYWNPEDGGSPDLVRVTLFCRPSPFMQHSNEMDWSCKASARMIVFGQKRSSQNHFIDFGEEVFKRSLTSNGTNVGYGFSKLVTDFLDESNGYSKNGKVLLAVHITAHRPKFSFVQEKHGRMADLWRHRLGAKTNRSVAEFLYDTASVETSILRIDKIVESGTAHLVIDNIRALFEPIYGPRVLICSMNWYLIACPKKEKGRIWNPKHGGSPNYVALYLQCQPPVSENLKNRNWSCRASAKFVLFAQKPSVKNQFFDLKEDVFKPALTRNIVRVHGFSKFMEYIDLLDESKGYSKNGKIVFAAQIKAQMPKFTRICSVL